MSRWRSESDESEQVLGARKRSRNLEPNLVPLINVIFLLTIFFLLAGRIQQADVIPVRAPKAQTGVSNTTAHQVLVVSKEGEMLLNNVLVSEGMLLLVLKKSFISNAAVVTLKADSRLPAERLTKLIRKLQDAGVKDISLVTEPR